MPALARCCAAPLPRRPPKLADCSSIVHVLARKPAGSPASTADPKLTAARVTIFCPRRCTATLARTGAPRTKALAGAMAVRIEVCILLLRVLCKKNNSFKEFEAGADKALIGASELLSLLIRAVTPVAGSLDA